jgi:hypothetical protein
MKYELINPSDKIYFDAPDVVHAATATALISTAYGGKCLEDGGEDSPVFLFSSASDWVQNRSGMTVDEFIENNAQTLHDTLASFRYDTERTSMSRIVDAAHQYADAINRKFLTVVK